MNFIHIISDDGRQYEFQLSSDITTIGRDEENDIVIRDPMASRKHAKILKKRKNYILTDLGSFNGTKVNEKFIHKARLNLNDEIRIGNMKLTFLEEKPSVAQTQTLVLSSESDYEEWHQEMIKIRPEESCDLSSEKLATSLSLGKKKHQPQIETELSSTERMNKVLFVLYEISRQLNSILDFDELLKKIMELIFMVINADYGFIVLTGEEVKDEFIPIAVKYRFEKDRKKGELKASRTIFKKVIKDKVAILTSNAMADSRLGKEQSLYKKNIRSAMCVPLWEKDKVIGAIQLDSTRFDNRFTEDDLELLKTIGCQIAMIIEQARLDKQIREEEKMRNRLERFHSPQIIEMIIKGDKEAKDNIMDAKDLTATILFTDIVEFTSLSEQLQPREINMILNQHFSQMTDIIFEYNGTLDKYLGDGLMAVFGAPVEGKNDAERAVLAAKKMRQEFKDMMNDTNSEIKFSMRIGINTGRVVAGNIGSPKRMDYTVIGDAVNVASRLGSIAKPNQILIGDETYKFIKGKFKINKIGQKKLRGKRAETMVYEVAE